MKRSTGLRSSRMLSVVVAAFALRCSAPETEPPPDDQPVPTCEPSGEPVTHGGPINADETWAPGIHLVNQTVTVRNGATLTLSPCSEIRLGKDVSINVDLSGKGLNAPGTVSSPIKFVRVDPSSAWGHLSASSPGTMTLSFATLEGGGGTIADVRSADYAGASLVGRGNQDPPEQVLTVDHVAVRGSTGLGVLMLAARFTAASKELTITGSGFHPLYTGANALSELPTGSYTGNAIDEILLQSVGPAGLDNAKPLISDVTIHNRGVPYRVGTTSSSIRVGDSRANSPTALLTIEAGVTLRFVKQGSMASQLQVSGRLNASNWEWEPQGALVVQGTSTDPVRFTSAAATPAAGDWAGLYFDNIVDPRSSITHAVIEYAGADSLSAGYCPASQGASNTDADCSIILFVQDHHEPSAFITQTRISNGLGCGIYRGWAGSVVDFRPTNEFASLTGCAQSGVRDNSGTCTACEQ